MTDNYSDDDFSNGSLSHQKDTKAQFDGRKSAPSKNKQQQLGIRGNNNPGV